MKEKVEIVNNAEQEIEDIYANGAGVTGELTKEQQERITELTQQGADARQVIWATTEDQYNVFKSQHYAEGVMYDEKGRRVSKYQKEFAKSMNEGKEALLKSYDEQIKKTREAGDIFGADAKEAVAQWEAKRSALLHFSE
jgi:vacuolar-type H+-ATPase subunit H